MPLEKQKREQTKLKISTLFYFANYCSVKALETLIIFIFTYFIFFQVRVTVLCATAAPYRNTNFKQLLL